MHSPSSKNYGLQALKYLRNVDNTLQFASKQWINAHKLTSEYMYLKIEIELAWNAHFKNTDHWQFGGIF